VALSSSIRRTRIPIPLSARLPCGPARPRCERENPTHSVSPIG